MLFAQQIILSAAGDNPINIAVDPAPPEPATEDRKFGSKQRYENNSLLSHRTVPFHGKTLVHTNLWDE
jgi:hypothetical protein